MKEEKYGILFKRAMVNYSSSLVAGRKKALVRAQQEGRMGGYKESMSGEPKTWQCGLQGWRGIVGVSNWAHKASLATQWVQENEVSLDLPLHPRGESLNMTR